MASITKGVVSGLLTHNAAQAGVVLVSPFLNEEIKQITTDENGNVNIPANLALHGVLGGLESLATGNNGLAGAVAGVAGEATVMGLGKLYGKSPKEMSNEEKAILSAAGQLAGGIAGGMVGDSTASGVAGIETAKRAVENNYLDQVLNNPQVDWQNVAEGQKAKQEADDSIREYMRKEHPVLHKTSEGAYYFVSKTGKVVYVARELVIELAPMIVAPEIAAGSKVYGIVASAALSGGANIVSQKLSGQEFNEYEFAGAIVSGIGSPMLKTTKDIVRFNAGVGMGVGLVNGNDGLSDAALSGITSYSSNKIPNPLGSAIIGEIIQKFPQIINSIINDEKNEE